MPTPSPAPSPTVRRFVRDWGDLAALWGVDRVTAQVHAVLWIADGPREAGEVAALAGLDPADAIRGVTALREIGVATADGGAAVPRYSVPSDPWEMFRAVIEERRRREVEPAVAALRDAVLRAESDAECDAHTRRRLEDMQSFLRDALTFHRQIAALPTPAVRRLLRLGTQLRRALGTDD